MQTTIVNSDIRPNDGISLPEMIQRIGRVAGLLAVAVLVFASLYFFVLYLGSA